MARKLFCVLTSRRAVLPRYIVNRDALPKPNTIGTSPGVGEATTKIPPMMRPCNVAVPLLQAAQHRRRLLKGQGCPQKQA